MRRIAALIVVLAFSSHAALAGEHFPSDVQAFLEKRDGCEHFSGEVPDPTDKRRLNDVIRQMDALCTGTDVALAKLKRKYRNTPAVMARLNAYEPEIEAHPAIPQAPGAAHPDARPAGLPAK